MKLFKKALLATAVFGAMGAQAATLSSAPLTLSAEGIQAGLTADDQKVVLDVIIGRVTPSGSTITLKFSDDVDLSDLESLTDGEDKETAVFNDTTNGKGYVSLSGADTTTAGSYASAVTFDYGTGSFTFDKFTVNADENTITFKVNIGNAITANSAFRITFAGPGAAATASGATNAGFDIDGAATVTYSSVDAVGDDIEVGGTSDIAVTASQFAFDVTKEFDGRIERTSQTTFAKNGVILGTEAESFTDTSTFVIVNNIHYGAAIEVGSFDVIYEGDFDNDQTANADPATNLVVDSHFTAADTAGVELATNSEQVTVEVASTATATATTAEKLTKVLQFSTAADSKVVIPQTGDITAKLSVTPKDTTKSAFFAGSTDDAGDWQLDATVINIPYFPVGFEGLSSSVHFANESSNKAEVLVTAIALGEDGETYSGVLPALAGKEVTKYSQGKIKTALGLADDAKVKLSVTFNIDATEGDVNAYAFSSDASGRQALVTSQQKGK